MRIAKFLAHAGVASRRKSEELIDQGLVTVNGEVCLSPATTITPHKDTITVRGKKILLPLYRYILLNKPKGYVCSHTQQGKAKTIFSLLPLQSNAEELAIVGRLDKDSEGLVLLTNDGELANQLTHPRFSHEKEYEVTVSGSPTPEDLQRLSSGVTIQLDEGPYKTFPCKIELLRQQKSSSQLRVILTEGKKRQIRRMFESFGFKVESLKRVRIQHITLQGLTPGKWKEIQKPSV